MLGVQAYLAGLTFALAASPCSTPVLATLLGYVATSKVLWTVYFAFLKLWVSETAGIIWCALTRLLFVLSLSLSLSVCVTSLNIFSCEQANTSEKEKKKRRLKTDYMHIDVLDFVSHFSFTQNRVQYFYTCHD